MTRLFPKEMVVKALLAFFCSMFALNALSQPGKPVQRPPITGFDHVAFYAKSPEATKHFYVDLLGLSRAENANDYRVGKQVVEAKAETPPHAPALLAHIAFATPDAEGMRLFLDQKGVKVPSAVKVEPSGAKWFSLEDPEGNNIEFVQQTRPSAPRDNGVSSQIIHAGFLVHDRAAEDRFYRDILGFRLYWHGAMKEGRTDWVAMQVPEGRQWIEYMLLHEGMELTPHMLGVLNHFSLGVKDIHVSEKFLSARGWTPNNESKVQMGRDGKYQLNVYDPDGTRVELMEFVPAEKPCCASFTGPHPEEKY